MIRSVLVVDDDASFRHLATKIVRSWGHRVVGEAGRLDEALDKAARLRPDTVVADIGLPDGDGFALTRDLVRLPDAPRVVLISSDSDPGNGPAAQRVGACGFVPKDELTTRLRQLIEDGAPADPATAPGDARAVVRRHYASFNARDLDAYADTLAEDVEITTETGTIRGRAAARAFVAGLLETFPQVVIDMGRVVAEGPDTVVTEATFANAGAAEPQSTPDTAGVTHQIIRVREGRIVSMRSSYAARSEPLDVSILPPLQRAANLADDQAALRRVATLVARGVSEDEVFDVVNRELAGLVAADTTSLLRFERDDTITLVAAWARDRTPLPVGARRPVDDMLRSVRESGQVIRFGPAEVPAEGPFAREAREFGIRAAVGVPITVDGRVWGMSFAASLRDEPFPEETGRRIAEFTELVATALANAQARTQLQALADEQAPLRRVAERVARGASPAEIFEMVVVETCDLLKVTYTGMCRVEPDGATTLVALHNAPEEIQIGECRHDRGRGVIWRVLETGRSAHVDDYAKETGFEPERQRRLGMRSGAGAPIVVQDRLWGVIMAMSSKAPMPRETEDRLAQFAGLVATAISSAQARADLRAMADEQAALRRVAELVARGSRPTEVFDAVALEASRLLHDTPVTVARFEPGGAYTVIAGCQSPFPLGETLPIAGGGVPDLILRTGRAARVDDHTDVPDRSDSWPPRIRAACGAPIVVDGRTWGVLYATSSGAPLSATAERDLDQFASLVAAAIANAESRAQLTASRARVIAAADDARRQLQRDVHDGAQQRLVQTVIALQLAAAALADGEDGAATELVGEALQHAQRATAELRDVVHGVLPASLARGGLHAGIESLVAGLPLPVSMAVDVPRLPPGIETTGYFVIAEALTNVVKHARATRAEVRAAARDGALEIEVRDDGAGGADASRGSGLTGLLDRVAAAEGTLTIASAEGEGTTLRASLPVPEEAAAD
ncbi:MAG TPA: GAF domain-containing protein [Solirubrobacteraceae bacterium]|jgi:signal transduction histidine kinase/DNA-binding NarL/FixJ family response regulator/uncharacterized protein YoaH (UPF0181 family)